MITCTEKKKDASTRWRQRTVNISPPLLSDKNGEEEDEETLSILDAITQDK